jgi:hypothetical protein
MTSRSALATAAAVLGVAALAACGSSSSSGTTTKTVHGTEHVSGKVTGLAALASNTAFSVTWTGPVTTTGKFETNGPAPKKGQEHTFTTGAGKLVVKVSATPASTQKMVSTTTCRFAAATRVPYSVLGSKSTGAFKGARGSGTVAVIFHADLPKKNGKCDESRSARPVPRSAVGTFSGGGPMTITK